MEDRLNPCNTKVFYDTQFEAEVAAARHITEMRVYQCGTHYHLTHADAKWSRGYGGGKRFVRCPNCKQIIRSRGNQYMFHSSKKCVN